MPVEHIGDPPMTGPKVGATEAIVPITAAE